MILEKIKEQGGEIENIWKERALEVDFLFIIQNLFHLGNSKIESGESFERF